MFMSNYLKIEKVKFNQRMSILVSIFIFFIFLFFLITKYNSEMLFLFCVMVPILFYLNFFQRRFFDITIENELITIENIWERKTFSLDKLQNIKQYDFLLPTLFNPFLKFEIKGQKNIITQIPNIIHIYFSKGGLDDYILKLNDDLISKKS